MRSAEMTVNYSFDLEDDDFLDDTFRSIPENDLLSYSISNPATVTPLNNNEFKDFQAPSTSGVLEYSSINTVNTNSNKKDSLSILFKSRESISEENKEIESSIIHSSNKSVNADETAKINSRFIPGFTPKAKKMKLPGIAAFFSESNDQHLQHTDSEHLVAKGTTADIEIKNITDSQFSSEDLLLPSWQNLQSEVSSCHNLLSTAKYYSIRRVLHETSKKKLPKHLVVPVLCVLIKKFKAEESSIVFMDDTGEITGKIDKEVIDMYKDAIQERTALILKKVTCICNILFLKKQNLVSIYLDNGSVKRVQDLNSILDKEEPLKPMNCQCPGTPNEQKLKNPLISKVCDSTSISSKTTPNASHKMTKKIGTSSGFNNQSSRENRGSIKNLHSTPCPPTPMEKDKVLNILEAMIDVSKKDSDPKNSILTSSDIETTEKCILNSGGCSTRVMKHDLTTRTLNREKNCSNQSTSRQTESKNNPSFINSSLEEDLFCEDADDFDEFLCSLDEKSFLQEI